MYDFNLCATLQPLEFSPCPQVSVSYFLEFVLMDISENETSYTSKTEDLVESIYPREFSTLY